MKTIIIYKTRSGSSKQYAEWIKEENPKFDILPVEEVNLNELENYDKVIFCSATYGGQIIIKGELENFWEAVKNKKVYLVVVGAVPMEESWSKQAFKMINQEIRENLAGYIKIPGKSPNQGNKEPSRLEKWAVKFFLRTDHSKINTQTEIKKEDLQPVFRLINN